MKKRRLPKHKYRPKRINGPKLWAFPKGALAGAKPVHADKADDEQVYEYAFQVVILKKFPKRKDKHGIEHQRPGRHYAFKAEKGSSTHRSAGMTKTHAMMQAIICEVEALYCLIDGKRFSSELTDPQPERDRKANMALGQGKRRPDISANAHKCSIREMNGGPLDIEIAVTNPIDTFTRHSDLIKAQRPCIEVVIPRDKKLEEKPGALEIALREALYAGTFEARWIVDPNSTTGKLVPLPDVEKKVQDWLAEAVSDDRRLKETISSCEERATLLTHKPSAEVAAARAELAKIEKGETEILRFAGMRSQEELGEVSLLRFIIEAVFPILKDERLRSHAERWSAIDASYRAEYGNTKTGIRGRLEKLERGDRLASETVDRERLHLGREKAAASALLEAARYRTDQCRDLLRKIEDLRRKNIDMLLETPDHDWSWMIRFEHKRWC
jgi:hypothetical protein